MMPRIFPFEFYWKYGWGFTSPGILLVGYTVYTVLTRAVKWQAVW
jgi:hypothetical protein